MEGEISVMQVEKRIRSRVKRQMEKTQREYYLNEQAKAIQKELGDTEDGRDETAEIEDRIQETKLTKEAREKANAELKKLKSMSPMSAESTVVRNYLDSAYSVENGRVSVKICGYAGTCLMRTITVLRRLKNAFLNIWPSNNACVR